MTDSALVLAQSVAIPDFPWAALSPELVLFAVGILALLVDTAGVGRNGARRPGDRVQSSFAAMIVILAASGAAWWQNSGDAGSDVPLLAGLVGLGGILQFVLTFGLRDQPRQLGAILAFFGFAAGLGVTIWQWVTYADQLAFVAPVQSAATFVGTESLLGGMVAVDGVALFTRFSVMIAGLITIPVGYAYMESRQIHRGEYYPLLLFAATGMTLLASSNDLIMVFIAVEILSLALYVMSGLAKRDLNAQESALKYFMLGAFSSALLLYGIALTYGVAGTTNIPQVGTALSSISTPDGLVVAAIVMLLVGFGFKTGMVPFHFWTPDVYQGAPTPVTGFMAAATKAAAFAAFIRVFVGALAPLQWLWSPVVIGVAVVTMLGGAVLAIVQTDVKRILAYSAIAHAGYVAIGLVSLAPGEDGAPATGREAVGAMLLYLLIYAFVSVGSFGVVGLFERRLRRSVTLADLRGVGRTTPAPALAFALFLISLAGIPGTAGFTAKFAVFRSGVESGQLLLVIVGVLSSVIAAFFYLRIIASMFVEESPETIDDADAAAIGGSLGFATVGIAAAAVVVFGILPGALVSLAQQAGTFAS